MTRGLPTAQETDASPPDPILAALQSLMHGDISVMITNATGVIEFVNPAFEHRSGYSSREIVGQTPAQLDSGVHSPIFFESLKNAIRSGSVYRSVFARRHRNGGIYHEDSMITPIRNAQSDISHYLSTGRLLPGLHAATSPAPVSINADVLAVPPNRCRFIERLGKTICRSERDAQRFALLHIDLDHFRRINDTLGHSTGDRVLAAVARRIAEQIEVKEALTHLGGDEFTIILEHADSRNAANQLAESLINECSRPLDIEQRRLYAAISIGIAAYPDDGDDIDALMRHAEIAMYHAKSAGRNRFAYFHADMETTMLENLSLEGALRNALRNREFEVFYQPIVSSVDHRCIALEALLRWHSPVHGEIPPARFVPMLEEIGLITTVGRWVLHTACRQFKAMASYGLERAILAVNLSGCQFRDDQLVGDVQAILNATQLAPGQLELEITESVLVDDASTAGKMLQALAALGVRLAIDDFGTGYSSLSYLRRFPINTLKIDRSFVAGMESSDDAQAIVRSIASLADNLGMTVVAEGVESAGQLALLAEMGCARVQGFLFSRPLPVADLEKWLPQPLAARRTTSGRSPEPGQRIPALPMTHRATEKTMKTIFLVDDSTTILLSISSILSKAGYAVDKAASAEEALSKFNAGIKANLLITDLNMPGMDGIELIREVRKLPAYKFLPILFLTTESQQAKKQEAKAAGASGWIVKPATADELLGTIKLVIR